MRAQIYQVTGPFQGLSPDLPQAAGGTGIGNAAFTAGQGLPRTAVLPVLPALAGLLPAGGLARGR